MGAVGRLDPGLRSKMKIFAVLLLATAILGMEMEHEKMFKTWTKMKAHEACWGEENTKKYTVQLKRAVAKCTHQDAPELELPIYRSPYRVVNALLNNANQHERYVVNLLENIVDNLNNNQRHNNNQQYNERRHDQNYNNHYNQQYNNNNLNQYQLTDWFKKRIENDYDNCYAVSQNVPASAQNAFVYPGNPHLTKLKAFMSCCKMAKLQSCVYQDVKVKLEKNFGPLQKLLDTTGLTEQQIFPLVMQLLHGNEMEYFEM